MPPSGSRPASIGVGLLLALTAFAAPPCTDNLPADVRWVRLRTPAYPFVPVQQNGGGPFEYESGYDFARRAADDANATFAPRFYFWWPPVRPGQTLIWMCPGPTGGPQCMTFSAFPSSSPPPGYVRNPDRNGVYYDAGCPNGGQLHYLADPITDPFQQIICLGAPANLTLRLANEDPSGEGDLATLEPGKTAARLWARAYCNGEEVGATVRLELQVEPASGGHAHADEPVRRPRGTLSGNGQSGEIITVPAGSMFSYTAPVVAGDHTIEATCLDATRTCTQEGPKGVWVGIRNLQALQADPNYVLIKPNADQNHPSNHYVSVTTQEKIQGLAADYRKRFPNDPPLYLNDASLVRGGLFDLGANWSSRPRGHSTHRFGTDIDTNESIPTSNYVDLMNTVAPRHGCNAQIHSGATLNEHFHLYCR